MCCNVGGSNRLSVERVIDNQGLRQAVPHSAPSSPFPKRQSFMVVWWLESIAAKRSGLLMRKNLPCLKLTVRPWKQAGPQKETIVLQLSIFRCENVSFRAGRFKNFQQIFVFQKAPHRHHLSTTLHLRSQSWANAQAPDASRKPWGPAHGQWMKCVSSFPMLKIGKNLQNI